MAIDRMSKFRADWISIGGLSNRLEIIPAGAPLFLDDLSVITFDPSLVAYDFSEASIESLPIGMVKPAAASFTFDADGLSAELLELLRAPRYTYGVLELTTLFVFYSDEGSGGDLVLQYIGAQSPALGNKFDVVSADYSLGEIKIETFDLMKTVLDTLFLSSLSGLGSTSGNYVDFPSNATEIVSNLIGLEVVDFTDDTFYKYDIPPSFRDTNYLFYSFDDALTAIVADIRVYLSYWIRAGAIYYEPDIVVDGGLLTSLTFHKQTKTLAHTKGAALTSADALILGHVTRPEGSNHKTLGGFFSPNRPSVADFDSLSTLLGFLIENLVCKFKFLPVVRNNPVSGKDLLTYDFYIKKPLESIGSRLTLDPAIIGDSFPVETAKSVYLIAQSETLGATGKDVASNRVARTTKDSTDHPNTKILLNNSPTVTSSLKGTTRNLNESYLYRERLSVRKIYYREGGETFKVHESVMIDDGENTKTLDSPIAFLPNDWHAETVDAWAIATQQTQGLAQAIAEYYTEFWSDLDQCERSFRCNLVAGDADGSLSLRHVGDVFNLPAISAVAAGSLSVLLSIKPDYELGEADVKFLSFGA